MEIVNYQFEKDSFVGITDESLNVLYIGNLDHIYVFSLFHRKKLLPIAGFMRVKMK